ncbi:MAG: histidine phosphatase family protein [Flavobacteriaceae bacterium]|nr:histidine phosphatase family protein [Flavobacteriaceae bacterium]
MKNLYLLRHAKSSWELPSDDHKRPLQERGKKDALLVSDHTKSIIKPPEKIISSDATRAETTANYFKKSFNVSSENFITNESLYDFRGKKVLEVIKSISNSLDCVLIVGHNNALTLLANMLGNISIVNIPTCGFVEIQFNVEKWGYINYGQTTNIIFPRNLKTKQ